MRDAFLICGLMRIKPSDCRGLTFHIGRSENRRPPQTTADTAV